MIRKGTWNDRERVYELICLLEDTVFDRDSFYEIYLRKLDDGMYACFVYEKEGNVVCVLNMRMEEQLHHCGKICEVTEFVVEAEERSRGIGEEMFRYACAYAEQNGCMRIELVTNRRRKDAHRFYERMGMNRSHYGYTYDLWERKDI